jgi:hypothetical protein
VHKAASSAIAVNLKFVPSKIKRRLRRGISEVARNAQFEEMTASSQEIALHQGTQ